MDKRLEELLLNPKTKAEAKLFIKKPAQTLLITGLPGSGKAALARALAVDVLQVKELAKYPYFLYLTRPKDKQEIPIEEVRGVIQKLRLRTPGERAIRRIVFIEDAHNLSAEAQNALLKLIEEPASDTLFILSTHSIQAVLPTIASRAQIMTIHPAALSQASKYYEGQKQSTEIESAWQLSQGSAGLMNALLFAEQDHPLKDAVGLAKEILQKNAYERLLELDKLSKDKEKFTLFLTALAKVLTALHHGAIGKATLRQGALIADRQLVAKLQNALKRNTSPRLVALELVLNLKD